MAEATGTLASSRLRRLARRPPDQATPASESCELCGEVIGPRHRHVLDLSCGELRCACQACTILFDSPAAGGGHYRLVPDRRLAIADLALDDAVWESLRIPVEMAFFFRSSPAERVLAFYPGPMGATESLLELAAWQELEDTNPVLRTLEPDVEALLVNRARGARQHFVVPIEDCYDLAGLIRTQWRGLTGGREVWQAIEAFFERLGQQAKTTSRDGQASPPAAVATGGGEETA